MEEGRGKVLFDGSGRKGRERKKWEEFGGVKREKVRKGKGREGFCNGLTEEREREGGRMNGREGAIVLHVV